MFLSLSKTKTTKKLQNLVRKCLLRADTSSGTQAFGEGTALPKNAEAKKIIFRVTRPLHIPLL
jgi:hypothetical protein